MRIAIFAVGQMKSAPEGALCEDFVQRIAAQGRGIGITGTEVREFAEARRETAAQRKADETARLEAALPQRAVTVALSERGRQMTSTEFSRFLQDRLEDGTPELVFLIGGPDGHDEAFEKRATRLLSLGAMTWPHRLARIMLSEQIYRAVTILTNHPYHRA